MHQSHAWPWKGQSSICTPSSIKSLLCQLLLTFAQIQLSLHWHSPKFNTTCMHIWLLATYKAAIYWLLLLIGNYQNSSKTGEEVKVIRHACPRWAQVRAWYASSRRAWIKACCFKALGCTRMPNVTHMSALVPSNRNPPNIAFSGSLLQINKKIQLHSSFLQVGWIFPPLISMKLQRKLHNNSLKLAC